MGGTSGVLYDIFFTKAGAAVAQVRRANGGRGRVLKRKPHRRSVAPRGLRQ